MTIVFGTRSTQTAASMDREHDFIRREQSSPASLPTSAAAAAAVTSTKRSESRRSAIVSVLCVFGALGAVFNVSEFQRTKLPSTFNPTISLSRATMTTTATSSDGIVYIPGKKKQKKESSDDEPWVTSEQLSGSSVEEKLKKKKGSQTSSSISSDTVKTGPDDLFPKEEDWLLSQSQSQAYNSNQDEIDSNSNNQPSPSSQSQVVIPKRLHKVFLRTNGHFPDDIFDMLSDRSILNLTKDETTGKVNGIDLLTGNNRLAWAHRSWKVYNPSYEIRYFNLNSCRSYLQRYFHPVMLRAFDCIEAFAGKADLFRYLVVYREGGFYSDWKQECMTDHLLHRLSTNNVTFVAAKDGAGGLSYQKFNSIQNSFIGATPQHPILATAIRIILKNIHGRADIDKAMTVHDSPYEMTSTIPLGRAFRLIDPPLNVPGGAVLIDFKPAWGLRFFWRDEIVIVHKCYGCGMSQNWTDGNNYIHKYEIGEYFCPDGPSLFNA